jgi:hypothetical protein
MKYLLQIEPYFRHYVHLSSIFLLILGFAGSTAANVVVNEIHYDPDLPTEWVEFIELHNSGTEAVDVSGWKIENAVSYTFPEGTMINADQYLVVAQDIQQTRLKYSLSLSILHGPFEGRLSNDGEKIVLVDAAGAKVDEVDYQLGFPWPTVGDPIPESKPGSSHSIQLLNPALDNNLGGSWRSSVPTPGKKNTVYAENIPPHIRQVEHAPSQPRSNQPVFITAKVTDSDGVHAVTLDYQIVDPGHYIHLRDAAYQTQWTSVAMNDNGINGDIKEGDAIFSVELPASLQVHRRLMRYRITVADSTGLSLRVPYADDPQPNFAYFVYDGVPDWTGSIRPGRQPEKTYSSEMLSTLPVYHLISSKEEVENCIWKDQRSDNEYHYYGTLVYEDQIFDHIPMRPRGGVWRFSMGKNMWKFNFNRGHALEARDNYGRKYDVSWDKLNLGACIQQGDYLHRGEQGMFESVGFKLFNMVGVETAHTHFVHFRIIDEEQEDGKLNAAHPRITDRGTQYDGDFWGLYLAVEQQDGRFLKAHGMPDGNLYKMEGGFGEIRNQSPWGVTDRSDLATFMQGYSQRPSTMWWRENVKLDHYYGYRTILEGIHHYDNAYGKNYYYYLNPFTSIWRQVPWDLDLTWADNMYGSGEEPFKANGLLNKGELNVEYGNRAREIVDLLFNPDQTGQLIDEFASFIYTPNGESFVDADRAMWDYHWALGSEARSGGYPNNSSKAGQGRFYQIAQSKDFPGMLNIMKQYVVTRGNRLMNTIVNDNDIPETPTLEAVSEDSVIVDRLRFRTSPYRDPQGDHTFAAMKWRIAEVEANAKPVDTGTGNGDLLRFISANDTYRYFKGRQEPSIPRSAWREVAFDDSNWDVGQGALGYGEGFIRTLLSDMRNNYTTFYVRKTFTVDDLEAIGETHLYILYDDGINAWLNGVLVAQANVASDDLAYTAVANQSQEILTYVKFPIANPRTVLQVGENVLAVQVLNHSLSTSSDSFFDANLVANPPKQEGFEPDPTDPITRPTKPLRYEIDPVWESEEMDPFEEAFTIPGERIIAGRTYRVRVRMKDTTNRWSHWSAPVQFVAKESESNQALHDSLRVTEVMYNPAAGSEYEFIELHNANMTKTLSLHNLTFTDGIDYTFPKGSAIEPGQYLLLTPSATPEALSAFRTLYNLSSEVAILGPYSGRLSNSGEEITLKTAPNGTEILSFAFSDGRGWPLSADGAGHSLVPVDSAMETQSQGSLYYGGNWRASTVIGGSPGYADPHPPASVMLNELMANTPSTDWIEIYNPTDKGIQLTDLYLSDDHTDLTQWRIPAMALPAHSPMVFDDIQTFGLGRNGEELFLSHITGVQGIDRVVDAIKFKAQEADHSWGRYPDGTGYWQRMVPSAYSLNVPGGVPVAIDELMYHPDETIFAGEWNTLGEYIELYNPSSQAVALKNDYGVWRIDDGVGFDFPLNTVIEAKERILLVNFDPADPVSRMRFLHGYGLDEGHVRIFGPYTGNLSNQGERITLEKPVDFDPADFSYAWAIQDEVTYFHHAPWPSDEVNGLGKSLQRISVAHPGNDPSNWAPALPSPGEAGVPETTVQGWMLY